MNRQSPGFGADTRDRSPRRVVALGGGTGMPAVLRGLRRSAPGNDATALTAVVTMSDDGGSSGRLRRARGLPPPGDVRNCLVALSAEEDLLAALFQHRYVGDAELGGHSLGNLILAALAEQTGSFLKAIEASSRVLRTRGRILPATPDDVILVAELEDGSTVCGETAIGHCRKQIVRVDLDPSSARATPGVVEAILDADLVVLGPGSLFTSLLPNLVVGEIATALRETRAVRVLVGNLVREAGEANGLGLEGHVRIVNRHVGGRVVDAVLANNGPIEPTVRKRYEDEGTPPLGVRAAEDGVRWIYRNLLAPGLKLRHDPEATAEGLREIWASAGVGA